MPDTDFRVRLLIVLVSVGMLACGLLGWLLSGWEAWLSCLCVATVLTVLLALAVTLRRALRRRREADPAYSWRHQALLALDQAANALLLMGYADETISARCYRCQAHSRFWRAMCWLVDWLFSRWERDHCLKSWQSEQRGTQLPPDYRQGRTL